LSEIRRPRTGFGQQSANELLTDPVNRRLLEELHAAPRSTMSALARRVGMSPPAVTERVQRMERAGVIAGWRMEVDPAALGLPLSVFVRIRPGPGQAGRLVEQATALPQVTEAHHITGEDCFLLRVFAESVDDLSDILGRLSLFGETTSSVVLSSPIPGRALPLPSAER
jgi:Lrp/AsnC family leucine-responsive transcriptional regulator